MAVVNMTRVRLGQNNDRGEWYNDVATLADTGTSDYYFLPVRPVLNNIGVEITGAGTGAVQFTFATEAELIANTALWTAWDTTSRINPAVTAWRLVSTGGVKTARVMVKTAH